MNNFYGMCVLINKMRFLPFLLLVGCVDGDFTEKSGQREAVALVWSFYGGTGSPPPIGWRDVTCSTPMDTGARIPGFNLNGDCVSGAHFERPEYINLAWTGELRSTALAHELLHAALFESGDADPMHARADWSLVADARAMIKF